MHPKPCEIWSNKHTYRSVGVVAIIRASEAIAVEYTIPHNEVKLRSLDAIPPNHPAVVFDYQYRLPYQKNDDLPVICSLEYFVEHFGFMGMGSDRQQENLMMQAEMFVPMEVPNV